VLTTSRLEFHPPLLTLLVMILGCGRVGFSASEEGSDATFAAHQVHDGFQIDKLPGGGTGVVESAHWLNWSRSPRLRVRSEGTPLGDLWLIGPGHVEVRDRGALGTGGVEPAWEDGAIRLTFRPAAGPPLRSGPFERIGGSGYSVLSRNAQTLLDVYGTYRADILDANNRRVGWWEVHIADPFEPRRFEAVVPDVSPVMEAGVTLALDSEIDWIEDHALDVYRGRSGGHLHERAGGGR
jgi:hypothetical protein